MPDNERVRTLVVDDNPLYAKTLELVLGVDPRIEIVGVAHDGVAGVLLAFQLRPDVVVMDVHMPRLDGIDATRRIRRELPTTRVVVVTSSATEDHRLPALGAGADAFLPKDSPLGELRATIAGTHNATRAPGVTLPEASLGGR